MNPNTFLGEMRSNSMAALHRGRTGGMRMDDEKEGRRRGGREEEIVPVKVEIVGTALSQACSRSMK